MTTPPIKRRRTAQQILLRRACQTKGVNKSQDADAEIFGRSRNGGIVVLPTMVRDLGRTPEKSPTRPVVKMRRIPAASTFVVSGERKTAGKLTVCETPKEDLLTCKKLKPSEGKRSASGQRSGYTSRGSTKSQTSNSYPSKWPKNLSQEEGVNVNSKGSLEEITKCSPLNRTPYDHNLNTPLKSGDSSQCPPIKKKARRRTFKTAAISELQTQAKPQTTETAHKRGSSQSCGAKIGRRAYSGEEVRHVKCPSKSNSEISNNSSKCKLNSGVTFKNYGGYSASETEFDTSAEIDRHFRCSDSFYKNIDKVSRPPSMYVNNGIWSLELPSETEMQEFLSRAEQEDHCANMTLSNLKSGECERKPRHERVICKCFNRNNSYCKCALMANRKGCATEADTGCGSSKRSPQEEECMSSSRNSVKFRHNDWNESDYTGHGSSTREESYHMERPCGECGYLHKQSNGCESGLPGTAGNRREPTNCPHPQSRLARPAYTMGACWGPHGTGNHGRGGPFDIEYECKPSEAFANRNCTEAITQTSKIIMTKRIDESVSHCTPNCSSFEENRSCPMSSSRQETINSSLNQCIKDDLVETQVNAQLKAVDINVSRSSKQEPCNSEQKSKHSAVLVVKSNSLIFQSDHKQVNLLRSNSVELVHLSSSHRPCKQELPSCSSCQQKLPPPSSPCKQALPPSSAQGSCNSYNSRHQQNCHQSNSRHQQNCQRSNSYNQQNCQRSNSYNQHNCHQSNSHHQQNCHQSNAHHQQNCHQSNSHHQQNCHQSNAHHQHNCHQSNSHHQCRENRLDQDCPSVTASLCECNHDQAKCCKRKTRNPRKRVRRSSRGRSRSSSARKDVNGCRGGVCNERRTQSYEDCYNNQCDQMEDQCDVIKILSILQKTVAGLEEEIKRGKGYESGRSSGNRFEPRRKNRAPCEQENTNLSNESCSSSPCQHELSPLSPTCQLELPHSSSPCQHELSPLSPPCQQELPALSSLCQQELSSCSPPCQQALCSSTPPCQQELCSSSPPCQQELPLSNPPCHQELPSSNAPCKPYGLSHSRPFCQQRSAPSNQPCQPPWASAYKPHKCHHHGCPYANAYSQPNNGAIPISFGRSCQANKPYKYGMHSTSVYQDRKALPLACNWNQTNQRFLKTAYRNNQDLGMARGCTRTEQNYQSNVGGRKTHLYPYTQPTYSSPYKQNRSINDPEGHIMFPYTNWFRNNQRTSVPPGNSLARNEMKCSLDATQLGNQDTINRGRVTFQNHVSSRSTRAQSYQTDNSFPYVNCFGEMKSGLPNAHHKKPCKAPQNVDNLRNEVCYKKTETLCTKSLAPAECHQGSPQAHELNKSCALPVQRIIKEIDLEDCENSNSSEVCLENVEEINMEVCENKHSCDKFPRNRQDIDTEICENPNCPHRFHRHKRELDLEDCENPNCPYRNRIAIDLEVCENPNCPYRCPRNREDIDLEVCDNPKCPYRFQRCRDDTDSKVCDNPNCPYRFRKCREALDSEICESPNAPYRFKTTIKEIDLVEICENPSCPFRFPRNMKDIDLVCENPNCPYRIQRNRTEIDSEVYEYSNTSDSLQRSPNITILCNNPKCPSKLNKKRACAIPYQEISDSTLSECPHDLCEVSSSIESCEDPHCPVNTNNMWLSGGFESFDSNSVASQLHYVEYKAEENGFKEVATNSCHYDFSRRQRVAFTDVTNKTNRQDSGQSDRLDDDSIETKSFSKKWCHRYLPLDKIPINVASGVQPLGCNRNRHNPYLTSDTILNSYDKHILKNYQKHKVEKCRAREPIKVCRPVCRPKNQTRPRNYNCNRSTITSCNVQPPLNDYNECGSTSTFSDLNCSRPRRITNCQDNPRCLQSMFNEFRGCKRREIPRSQRAQPPDICCETYISENESHRNERATSKSTSFACCKKEKNPSPKTAENYCKTSNKSKKDSLKNGEKSTSKSSLFSCFKKKEKPCPQKREKNISEKERRKKNTSNLSLISCLKKKEEQRPPTRCQESYPTTGGRKNIQRENELQCEINIPKSCARSFCKKREKSASFQTENSGENGRKNYEKENDSHCEKTKSKSSGLPCSKKKAKIPPPKCNAKKEKHRDSDNENDSETKKNKSKSSGLLCFKKKEKNPSDQSENYAKKECRNVEEKKELHCKKTKSKSSLFLCSKKKEKSLSLQSENYCSNGCGNAEQENDSQSEKTKSKSSGFLCFKKKEKSPSFHNANNCQKINAENDLQSENTKSKSSGFLCFKKKEKPEENCRKKEIRKYAENENDIPKECEKKPSWLRVFPRYQRKPRNKDKGDDISEGQERTKKPSKLAECFSFCRKSKNRKEACSRIEECEECRKYQSTCPYHNEEVRVLYDSSFRFNQGSCSCLDIAENTNRYNPQEGSTASCRSENRHGQCECGNGFYKIGQ